VSGGGREKKEGIGKRRLVELGERWGGGGGGVERWKESGGRQVEAGGGVRE